MAASTTHTTSSGKSPTDIPGLDDILHGGIPRERTTLLLGGPGSGKTVLALQILANGAIGGKEPGIFVAFEENPEQIIRNAASFDWDLPGLKEAEGLFFLDARMDPELVKSGQFDLSGLLAILEAKAKEMGATRIVFDAIDVLLQLLDDPAAERQELFRLWHWLQKVGLTGIVTAKADKLKELPQFTDLQFMADCVISVNYELSHRVSLRNLWVMKYRGSSFAENEVLLTIGKDGIEVTAPMPLEQKVQVTSERVSTGVDRLDTMLNGGYFRGSAVLISGAPGTSKSTLSGAFVEKTCQKGESALYVSFDESAAEIIRNFSSVGIQLAPHVKSDRLQIHSFLTESCSAKEHFVLIRDLVETFQPACLVVDPLSALIKTGGDEVARGVAGRLIQFCKSRGVTVIATSLLTSPDQRDEATSLQISTIADTWIHLSYMEQGGERNRALRIIKSRGTKHSNQVRELILSDEGVTLTDAYAAGGEVLMGTLRWEKEEAERLAEQNTRADVARRRQEMDLASYELSSRLELLKREMVLKEAEKEILDQDENARKTRVSDSFATVKEKRSADRERKGGGSSEA